MKKKKSALGATIACLAAFGLGVLAGPLEESRVDKGVPLLIPYQGWLEQNGSPVNAIGQERVDFRLALFDDPVLTENHRVWPDETIFGDDAWDYHSVNVYSGRFALNIGEDKAYQHIADTPLYLEVQVRGPGAAAQDPYVPLLGRQRFLASPYSVAADRADTDFLVPGSLTAGSASLGNTTAAALATDNDLAVGGNLSVSGNVLQEVSLFGPWSQTECALNTVYTASTDLLVVAWGVEHTSQNHFGLHGFTPAELGVPRLASTSRVEAGSQYSHILMPVRNGDTWKIEDYGSADEFHCWTLPLGH
jgi:hypothetical protein